MNKKWDLETVREYINKYECELLSDKYISTSKKIKIKCHCGNIFECTFNNYRNSKHKCCKKCSSNIASKLQAKTNESFVKEVFEIVGNEYTFIDEYKTAKEKIKVIHNICGNVYEVSPDKFIGGRRCPKCNGGIKLTNNEFVNKVEEIFGDEYTVIGNYVNNHTNVEILHRNCGYKFNVLPLNFLREMSGCHKCNCSKGERKIQHILEKFEVNYKIQYTFEKLRGEKNRPFPFDFVVFLKDRTIAIEYDGEQHFHEVNFFGGNDKFKKQQESDKKKKIFCDNSGIELIRIPYYDYNKIEIILKEAIL